MKKSRCEVQKGPIEASQSTMQHQLRSQVDKEDAAHRAMKFDNMTPKLHMPKQ